MNFEQTFAAAMNPIWSEHYIDIYKLQELSQLEFSLNKDTPSVFFFTLEREVDKYINFYVIQEIQLSIKKEKAETLLKNARKSRAEEVHVLLEKLVELAREAMETCLFLNINMQATRVLLTHYENHVSKYQRDIRDHIYEHISEVGTRMVQLLSRSVLEDLHADLKGKFFKRAQSLVKACQRALGQPLLLDGLLSRLDTLQLCVQDLSDELRELKDTSPFSLYLYHQIGAMNQFMMSENPAPTVNLVLTLLLVFFFMTNYYMLSISAEAYLEYLDIDVRYIGLLNACSPASGFLFSLVTGMLTNYSFKIPIVLACLSILMGNFLYMLAVSMRFSLFLFIGRLSMGIAGSGLISRRYMAEHLSYANRARWSAGLVSASGLAMAVGPLAAVLFQSIEIGSNYIHKLNVPCIFWVGVFIIYTGVMLLTFREVDGSSIEPELESHSTDFSYTAVCLCLWLIAVGSSLQESFITGSPVIAQELYDWDFSTLGIVVAVVCFVSTPFHCLIGVLVFRASKVYFLLASAGMVVVSAAVISFTWRFELAFVVGSFMVFLASDVLNGVSNALLTVKMPRRLWKLFKSTGVVSTIAVLFGKTCGNLSILAIASMSFENLLLFQAYCWIAVGVLSILLIALTIRRLREADTRSDD